MPSKNETLNARVFRFMHKWICNRARKKHLQLGKHDHRKSNIILYVMKVSKNKVDLKVV